MKRRDFLKFGGVAATSTVAAAAGSVATPRAQGQDSQDKRYRVALIGTGWYGKIDLFRLMQVADVDVVALCDVDQPALEEAVKLVAERAPGKPAPQPFHDYREMLEKMDLDIVLIGTPDHWHALQMIDAVNSGADVYVQKPIGVDVKECLAMLRVARDKGAVVQVGLQRRSTPHLIQAKKEIVDSGKLGRVGQVELFSYYGGPGAAFRQQTETPPEGFDYDFWCGPAPKIPYYPCLRKRSWRQFMEYGNGVVGDMAVHMFDMARWMLDLKYPQKIYSVGGQYIKRGGISNTTDTQTVVFDYGDMLVSWNHRTWSELPDRRHPWGGYFYGENGVLKASVLGYDFHRYYSNDVESVDVQYDYPDFPEDKNEPNIELHCAQAIRDHMTDFINRIKDRGRPRSDIEEGAISTICCILGNISMTLGRAIQWDPEKQCCVDDDEANALLQREYREPWKRP